MDQEKALQILAHLLSQQEFRKLLEDAAELHDLPLHVVLSGGGGTLSEEDVQCMLKDLMRDATFVKEVGHLVSAEEAPGEFLNLVALVLGNNFPHLTGGKPGAGEPRTLREAIDQEWPW